MRRTLRPQAALLRRGTETGERRIPVFEAGPPEGLKGPLTLNSDNVVTHSQFSVSVRVRINHMRISLATLLIFVGTALAYGQVGRDLKDAGKDTKDAAATGAKKTKTGTKKAYNSGTHETKKGIHKAAHGQQQRLTRRPTKPRHNSDDCPPFSGRFVASWSGTAPACRDLYLCP